jgi:HEAT repeat protein
MSAQTPDMPATMLNPPSSLANLVLDSPKIIVLAVDHMQKGGQGIVYRKVADVKGKSPGGSVTHQLEAIEDPRERQALAEWAAPGRTAIAFCHGPQAYVCVGNRWYPGTDGRAGREACDEGHRGWQQLYVGSVRQLREHVRALLAGKDVVLTARAPDEFPLLRGEPDQPIWQDWSRGKRGRVWRIRVGPRLDAAQTEASRNFVGWGAGGREVVPALVDALRDGDAHARAAAAEDLRQLGETARAAAPALRAALRDSDVRVRIFAAAALGTIDPSDRHGVPVLTATLGSWDPDVRGEALAALAALGPGAADALPKLLAAVADRDKHVRSAAAFALGHVGPGAREHGAPRSDVVPALAGVLRRAADPDVRMWTLRALLRFGPDAWAAAAELRASLNRDPPGEYAADLLARLQPPAVDLLTDALQDPECPGLRAVLDALSDLGPEARDAVPSLLRTLQHTEPRIRLWAAQALLSIDRPAAKKAVPVLADLLTVEDFPYRVNVFIALGELGPAAVAAMPTLIQELDGRSRARPRYAAYAARALGRMGRAARSAAPALRASLRSLWPDSAVALGRIGFAGEARAALTADLGADDDRLRLEAAEALAEVGPANVVALSAVRKALRQARRPYQPALALAQWRMAETLGRPGPGAAAADEAVEALTQLVSTKAGVREEATIALGDIGPPAKQAVPALRQLLEDDELEVRAAAVRALWRIGTRDHTVVAAAVQLAERHPRTIADLGDTLAAMGPRANAAVPVLLGALRHEATDLYLAAARALERIDPDAADRAWSVRGLSPTARRAALALSSADRHALWADLGGADACRAYRAVWLLAVTGDEAVALIGKHVWPAEPVSAEHVARLLDDLEARRFATRQAAAAELEHLGDLAGPAMRRRLAEHPSLEVRRRLEGLLEKLDAGISPVHRRNRRAVVALEQVGTRAARRELRRLAGGAPDAALTRNAKAALDRLEKSPARRP